jgi:hypothetical protein
MISNKGWSFCVVTAPGNESALLSCIEAINLEFSNLENYEIIVVGDTNISVNKLDKVQVIHFSEEFLSLGISNIYRFIRERSVKRLLYRTGAICHKKNLAAKKAKYNKLCMMHDYVALEKGWRKGFDKFGEEWNISMNVINNKDGSRHRDWMSWDHPAFINRLSACLMPYDRYNKYMYISGTYFCVKKAFFLDNLLDEKLFWGEEEDVEWSLRVRVKTVFRMNIASKVRYLKLKSLDEAPYCDTWINNEKYLLNFLDNE